MSAKTEDHSTFDDRIHSFDPEIKPRKRDKIKKVLAVKFRMPWMKVVMIVLFLYGTMTVTKVVMENELGPRGI